MLNDACDWDDEELEYLDICPVCGCTERKILYSELIDNVFFVSGGKWNMYSCIECQSAYLDPRPRLSAIDKAYSRYYTHKSEESVELIENNINKQIKNRLENGYTNFRYGSKKIPYSYFGLIYGYIISSINSYLDAQYRYLLKPKNNKYLLDIGSGNGDYLIKANEAGWLGVGIEPDSKASEIAKKRGLYIYEGTIDLFDTKKNVYDAITISHVLEHVHNPKILIDSIYRLLKPNGILYLDTPNIDSYGAKKFGKNWRGIEAPRHLILFNNKSVKLLLTTCGFVDIKFMRRTDVRQGIINSSMKIAGLQHKSNLFSEIFSLVMQLFVKTPHMEYITLIARK